MSSSQAEMATCQEEAVDNRNRWTSQDANGKMTGLI